MVAPSWVRCVNGSALKNSVYLTAFFQNCIGLSLVIIQQFFENIVYFVVCRPLTLLERNSTHLKKISLDFLDKEEKDRPT